MTRNDRLSIPRSPPDLHVRSRLDPMNPSATLSLRRVSIFSAAPASPQHLTSIWGPAAPTLTRSLPPGVLESPPPSRRWNPTRNPFQIHSPAARNHVVRRQGLLTAEAQPPCPPPRLRRPAPAPGHLAAAGRTPHSHPKLHAPSMKKPQLWRPVAVHPHAATADVAVPGLT